MAKQDKKSKNYAYGIWFVIVLIIVFFITFLIFRGLGTIEHEGLTFKKERVGSISVYHYYYLYKDASGQIVQNNIYLRNNPAKNEIPINEKQIYYPSHKFVYVSINASALEGCPQSSIAISTLASFIANGGLTVKGGSLEQTNATANNVTQYITCHNKPVNPIIQINSGNTSEISINNLCYDIRFSRCEDVLPAVEKFIVQSILDAKGA